MQIAMELNGAGYKYFILVHKHWIPSCSLWSQRLLPPFFFNRSKVCVVLVYSPSQDTQVALSPPTAGWSEGCVQTSESGASLHKKLVWEILVCTFGSVITALILLHMLLFIFSSLPDYKEKTECKTSPSVTAARFNWFGNSLHRLLSLVSTGTCCGLDPWNIPNQSSVATFKNVCRLKC